MTSPIRISRYGLPHFVWRCHDYIYYNLTPDSYRGYLDYYYYRPDLFRPWGGAFNGQRFRRFIFNELLTLIEFEAVIETGTYTGTTTVYFDEHVLCPIYSVELNPRFQNFSRLRLRDRMNIHLFKGDSRKFLNQAVGSTSVPKGSVFFYLDAHWQTDLPLAEEVHIILDTWSNPVIMIDDFAVPGDKGYTFDDYGPGKALTESYLREHNILERTRAFYPSAPSSAETGMQRGCVVLTNRDPGSDAVARAASLKERLA